MTQAVELTSSAGTIPQAWVDPKKARLGETVLRTDITQPPVSVGLPEVWTVTQVYRVGRDVVFDRGSNTTHTHFFFLP